MAMASGEQLKNAKIAVLDLINKNKDILFGKLSDALTREVKESKWAEVADHAHALGAFPWHRTWDYLRDTTWQNWRKRFVEKREKSLCNHDKTGQVARIVFDEADLLIMEILEGLGKNVPSQSMHLNNTSLTNLAESAISDIHDVLEIEMDLKTDPSDVTDGSNQYSTENHILRLERDGVENCNNFHSNQNHTMESSQDEFDEHTNYQNHNSFINSSQTGDPDGGGEASPPKIISTSSLSATSRASLLRKSAYAAVRSSTGRKRPVSVVMSSPMGSPAKELSVLKCRKIRAELELLQKESYKKDLEILQLERSLGLPASDMTRKFYRYARGNNSIMNNRSSNR